MLPLLHLMAGEARELKKCYPRRNVRSLSLWSMSLALRFPSLLFVVVADLSPLFRVPRVDANNNRVEETLW